jgi:predicted O-linked N-acetylglucosamine transferase (SPINDLY family)
MTKAGGAVAGYESAAENGAGAGSLRRFFLRRDARLTPDFSAQRTSAVTKIVTLPNVSGLESLRKSSLGDVIAHAEALSARADPGSAAAAYKEWIAYNATDPLLHAAYFNYGVALARAGDASGAMNATRECLRIKPDFSAAHINLGRLLEDAGQKGAGVSQWIDLTKRLEIVNGDSVKNKLAAFQQIGRVLEALLVDAAAEDALKQALDISVAQPEVIQHWISLRQRQCKWPVISAWEYVRAPQLIADISPLSLCNLADDPVFQLARAWRYNKQSIKLEGARQAPESWAPAGDRPSSKLRIGYVSSDLREHAVGFAMTDVIEEHDRSRFDVYAYYCGIDRVDPTQERIKRSVDRWTDINGISDEEAAAKIRKDKIDIIVDLNGYTKDARTRVFALRPAPIAVNWFGFPGTMGSPYHHYIIADDAIIPPDQEIYYSEKVLRLACYQPNDRKRVIAANPASRRDEGLPEGALVYCSLNGPQKFTPEVFLAWMAILTRTPGSVLWLLGAGDDANSRLRERATQQGVAPERLIFAQKKPNPEHLARYALADLFLDTFPYGAHTTASDAMWMGVPILTMPGKGFASRVCASLVKAAGIGELICVNLQEYIDRAVAFGQSPGELKALRQRLLTAKDASLLFDTPRLVSDLEKLYRSMWADFQSGALPQPDLSNLDVYEEVGLDLGLEDVSYCGEDAYRAMYIKKLKERHAMRPIRSDGRLWRGSA